MHRRRQHGQIAILFAIVIMVLVVFAALALDGGMIYVDRRTDQTVADSTSLAGVSMAAMIVETNPNTACADVRTADDDLNSRSDIADAVIDRAEESGITALADYPCQPGAPSCVDPMTGDPIQEAGAHGVWTECQTEDADTYLYIHTYVTTQVSTNFIHLFDFDTESIKNSVSSTARIKLAKNTGYPEAIISLNRSCHDNDGMRFDGGVTVLVNGGGIHSNSCMDKNGSSGSVTVIDAEVTYVVEANDGARSEITPPPEQVSTVYEPFAYTPPDCATLPLGSESGDPRVQNGDVKTINPGRYSRIRVNGGQLTMNSGLYCLNGNFSQTGGVIDANGITIYAYGSSPSISITGNAEANLAAACSTTWEGSERECQAGEIEAESIPTPATPFPGFILIMADGSEGDIDLTGNSSSALTGTVYAPDGDIDIGGNSSGDPTYNTQIIGNNVTVHGNPGIDIRNIPRGGFSSSSSIDLFK